MTITAIRPITIDEFLQLPETKPASEFIFIDGQITQKPMPQGEEIAALENLQIEIAYQF